MNIEIDPRIQQSLSLKNVADAQDMSRSHRNLRKSTREFEALYVFEMYKAMRKNVPENGLLQQSSSSKMFQEMLDMEMAREAASGKGMGIGEKMYDQLKDTLPSS